MWLPVLILCALFASPAAGAAPLTMDLPAPGATTNSTPAFSGSTLDASDEVKVLVYAGGSASGEPLRTLETAPLLASWEVVLGAGEALSDGTYTAVAEQANTSLSETAVSEPPVTFTVNTEPPTVSIVGPPSLSNDRTPAFSGTASEATEVVVHVFEGASEVAAVSTQASGGEWSTGTLSKALPSGKHSFTAYATEVSALGNPEGMSSTVAFTVDTESPTVSIVGPPSLSNNRTPAFSGTASEATEVVVHVFEGATEVASVSTTASGGEWSTSTLSKALPAGRHSFTAYATETSGLGNPDGESATVGFEVNTLVPVVSSVSPNAGLTSGGTVITITGSDLAGAEAVRFGAALASSFHVNSATSITATAPSGTGTVHVTVTDRVGTSATSAQDQFVYVPPGPAPTVTRLSVKKGPSGGGTGEIITGTNFAGATAVRFGNADAASFKVDAGTSIVAVVPPGTTGSVDVHVTTPNGESAATSKDRFTYANPTVTAISPSTGSIAGGYSVTVTGSGFAPGSGGTVFAFAKGIALSVNCASSTKCTMAAPAAAKTGAVDVRATTARKSSSKNPPGDRFTYN